MESQELQNLQLKIMAEVNGKISETYQAFDDTIEQLNREGTEYARGLAKDLKNIKNKTAEEIKNVWSFVKSSLVSIEAGQKMLYNPKDGIMTKTLEKVSQAIKMSRDSAECTAASLSTVREAKMLIDDQKKEGLQLIKEAFNKNDESMRDIRKIVYGLIVSLIILTIPISVASIWKLAQDYLK